MERDTSLRRRGKLVARYELMRGDYEDSVCELRSAEGRVSYWPMLSKKSPRTICRIGICNNRIGANGFSNRNCASAPSLESIFRARVSKIIFRQHRPIADLRR